MLVVEAREIGRGRLLAVEPEVLDLGRTGPEAILTIVFEVATLLLRKGQYRKLRKHWVQI